MTYNYTSLLKEINDDIKEKIITLDDDLFIIRRTEALFDDYRPILDYEYQDIPDGPCEKVRVSWVLKEMNDRNN